MEDSRTRLTWFAAFKLQVSFSANASDALFPRRAKTVKVVVAALVLSVCGLLAYDFDYFGAVPPQAPLVRQSGTLASALALMKTKSVKNQVAYVNFTTDAGVSYDIEQDVGLLLLEKYGFQFAPMKIYGEGFVLRNGKGHFFPLKLQQASGPDLLPPDQLAHLLQTHRDPLAIAFPYVYVLLAGCLIWLAYWTWRIKVAVAPEPTSGLKA